MLVASSVAWTSGQSVTIATVGDLLHVRAPELRFLEGRVLSRLQDGRSARIDFDLEVMSTRGGPSVTRARQTFNVSFDLWEQRFAVTRIGTPSRTVSHLTSAAAEAWCLDNVTVPVTAMGRLGRDMPFWVKLVYRVHDETPSREPEADAAFSMQTLIDALGRRRQEDDAGKNAGGRPLPPVEPAQGSALISAARSGHRSRDWWLDTGEHWG